MQVDAISSRGMAADSFLPASYKSCWFETGDSPSILPCHLHCTFFSLSVPSENIEDFLFSLGIFCGPLRLSQWEHLSG